MKKVVILVILIGLIGRNNQAKAQSPASVAGMAATVVAGIVLAGGKDLNELKKEMSLKGTQYILKNNPEITSFQLSVLAFEDVKVSDLYNTNCVSFGVMIFDPITGALKENRVLLMFSSEGWVNQYGLDFTKVRFDLFSKDEWGTTVFNYVNLASPVKFAEKNQVPIFKVAQGDSTPGVITIWNKGGLKDYYEKTTNMTSIEYVRISEKGVDYSFVDPKQPTTRKTEMALPFITIDGDRYLVKDFNNKYRVIYNEGSLMFFLKEVGELCLLRPKTVNRIQSFLQ